MLKKRSFWVGFLAGGIVIFFFAWFSIWATYVALEKRDRVRESGFQQIKRIIFLGDNIAQEEDAIKEWNEQHMKPKPIKAGEEE